jgi:glycosyltransferase involved in cell wall biosynthesis
LVCGQSDIRTKAGAKAEVNKQQIHNPKSEIRNPTLCFVGSMLGKNPGYVTTQGQIAAELFAADGYEVTSVSSKLNRVMRLTEIAAVLIKNNRQFDIVLLEVYSGLSFIIADLVSLLCRNLNLPLIMVLHGGNLLEFIEKYPRWTKRVLRRANCLVAPSPFLAQKIGGHGFAIKIVPNVIDIGLFPFRERKKLSPRLVWMRSFHPIYNPQMAINVLTELRKNYPEAVLTMAGVDKGLEPEIKKMAAELNLSDAVTFPGFLNAEQKAQIFSAGDIYLNTNRIDNMPVSVLEACAFGLPVVSTKIGGLPFLISHLENGLLVENEKVHEMVESVKLLLKDSNLAQKLSRNGRKLAERSGWKNVRADWEKLFAEVLQSKVKNSQ